MNFRNRRANHVVEEEVEETNDTTLELLQVIAGTKQSGKSVAVPKDAIVPAGDGTLLFKSFKLTRVGLIVEDAPIEDWESLGDFLRRIEGSLQWLIGDWLVWGERKYGQTYEQIAERTGYKIKTLYDYAYVAGSVEFSVRTENLTFGHHKLVAASSVDEQRYWLEQAAVHQWSVSQMRQAFAPTLADQHHWLDRFTKFTERHLKTARRAAPHERQQMADALRELANQIEALK